MLAAVYYVVLAATIVAMAQQTAKVLIYSATAGYRHASIPQAIESMKELGATKNIQFDNTEDPSFFTDANLTQYDALLFLMTTGQVLDDPGIAAFQRYLDHGGNFVGIHAASDSLTNVSFYGRELGAYFDYHPALQNATIIVLDNNHPSTSMLPERWPVQDEIYNFKSDPRDLGAVVVLTVDPSSYVDNGVDPFNQGSPHPIAWYQLHGAGVDNPNAPLVGRSFYTSLGHLTETWQNSTFLAHVMGGITWTLESGTTCASNPNAAVGNPSGSCPSNATDVSTNSTTTATGSSPSINVTGAAHMTPAGLGKTFAAMIAFTMALLLL